MRQKEKMLSTENKALLRTCKESQASGQDATVFRMTERLLVHWKHAHHSTGEKGTPGAEGQAQFGVLWDCLDSCMLKSASRQ